MITSKQLEEACCYDVSLPFLFLFLFCPVLFVGLGWAEFGIGILMRLMSSRLKRDREIMFAWVSFTRLSVWYLGLENVAGRK